MFLLAQAFAGHSIASIAIWVLIIAGIVAIVFLALRQMKVPIPDWVINMFWVIIVVAAAIAAIKFIAGMG